MCGEIGHHGLTVLLLVVGDWNQDHVNAQMAAVQMDWLVLVMPQSFQNVEQIAAQVSLWHVVVVVLSVIINL